MKFVDLTVGLSENTPVWPGAEKVKIAPVGILEKDGYEDHLICLETHVGTHIDAPSHMITGGKTLDQFPIERFIGRGVYVRIHNEFTRDLIKKAVPEKDDIVLFHTGRSDSYQNKDYFTNFPAITQEVAAYLIDRQVKMVGVDSASVDHEPYAVHKMLLRNGILILENLTNIGELSGKQFTVYAFPLKLNIDGAPARVVAQIR